MNHYEQKLCDVFIYYQNNYTYRDTDEPADGFLNQCTEMGLGTLSGHMFWRSRSCDEVPKDTYNFFGTICEMQLNTTLEGTYLKTQHINLVLKPYPANHNQSTTCNHIGS